MSARRLLIAIATLVMALLMAGCGGSAEPTGGAPPAESRSGFPVTIEHKYGSTEITAEPKRVVTVGLTEQDSVLALGVVPVGTTEWFGNHPGAIQPWAQDELGDAAKPEIVGNTDGLNFEKIAALRPDLILGLYSGLTQQDYDILSRIAPTVAQPAEYFDYGIPWQEQTRTAGQALGRANQAEMIVAELEARFAKVRAEHPDFIGTALIAQPYEGYYIYGPDDPRSRMLNALGFALPAGLDQVVGEEFGGNVSRERLDLLNTNALIWLVPDEASGRAAIDSDPLYQTFAVKTEGRDIFLRKDEGIGGATEFTSVLSLPVVLDGLVPKLAAAVDGDPGTT